VPKALTLLYQDWSETEQRELHRLREMFPPPRFEVECHRTDQQEPWCSVHDTLTDAELLHIARIGGAYIVVSPARKPVKATTISSAVSMVVSDR
jgi:hypothetical protein